MLAVGAAAVLFLHAVPLGCNDPALELACAAAGAAMGVSGGMGARLAVINLRGRRLAASHAPAVAAIPAGSRA